MSTAQLKSTTRVTAHPDPCHIIRILEGTASRACDEGLLVFSSEALADFHMKNFAPEESFYVISLSWRSLVEHGSSTYTSVVIDWKKESDTKNVLPLK